MSNPLTSLEATFISHKRGQRRVHPNRSLIRVEGIKSRENAMNFIGNAIVSEYRKDGKTYVNKGMITQAHGNNGVLCAKFNRNLPPIMVGKRVFLKLFKVNDLSY